MLPTDRFSQVVPSVSALLDFNPQVTEYIGSARGGSIKTGILPPADERMSAPRIASLADGLLKLKIEDWV